jgi:hypothetical protein
MEGDDGVGFGFVPGSRVRHVHPLCGDMRLRQVTLENNMKMPCCDSKKLLYS